MLATEAPFPFLVDLDGDPLDAGYVYFGTASQNPETSPVTVYWDAAGTQPAAQPLRTRNGYIVRTGTPALVYVSADYSVTVKDARGRTVLYAASSPQIAAAVALLADLASKVSAVKGSGLVGHGADLAYAAGTLGAKARERISVRDYPWLAVGDASTDDRAAIIAADTWCAENGYELYFPRGVYRCSDGLTQTAHWAGEGAPQLAPFPLTGDDKQYLRPGFKDNMPGATLLFTGTGASTATTQRADDFASFTYCVKSATTGLSMRGLAIVCDVDVYNSGGSLTAFGADNSATYGVGLYIDDAAQTLHEDVVVFGYFGVAGTVVRSVLGNDDPDYTIFRGGSTMGWRGLALIGSESNDGSDSGLSGTQCYGLDIFCSADHHSRGAGTAATIYASASTARCLYIDGYTDAAAADINGHYFYGGCIRSYVNGTIETDYASNLRFFGTVFETPLWSVTNSDDTQFIASVETRDVGFYGCRFSNASGIYDTEFAGTMTGPLTCVDGPFDGVIVTEQSGGTVYSARLGGASGGTADPAVQFLNGSPTSSTAGWSIRRDVDASDILDFRWGGTSVHKMHTDGSLGSAGYKLGGTLTIAAGVVTAGSFSYYAIDTEAAAATDDLDTINGGSYDGQLLVLRAANSGRDVVLKDATGNLRLTGDFTMTHAQDRIVLIYDGSAWCELSRADNTA